MWGIMKAAEALSMPRSAMAIAWFGIALLLFVSDHVRAPWDQVTGGVAILAELLAGGLWLREVLVRRREISKNRSL